MKIAVFAAADPADIRSWSGTPAHMLAALRPHFDTIHVVHRPRPAWFRPLRAVLLRGTGGRLDLGWLRSLAARDAAALLREVTAARAERAVGIAAAPLSAFLGARLPVVHVSDATFPLLRGYYPEFARLPARLAEAGAWLDRESARRAALGLFSSDWAAASAVRDLGAAPGRVHAIPWGCNIAEPPGFVAADDPGCCRLLFIGVDWQRKGGPLAVASLAALRALGVPARLDVVGPVGLRLPPTPGLQVHGRLSKASPAGRAALAALFGRASFLLLPSRQDCTPMVHAEAQAHGIPCIATDTGGVAAVVTEGLGGHLLPEAADAADYAALIARCWGDRPAYLALRASARARYEQVLNWPAWAAAAAPLIRAAACFGDVADSGAAGAGDFGAAGAG